MSMQMNHFDDQLPERRFDNFQFVNATQIMQRFHPSDWQRMEATFARDALMEIPEQYKVRVCVCVCVRVRARALCSLTF